MSLIKALHVQADTCADLGSPFNGQILHVIANNITPGTPLTDRLLSWPGDISARGHSVPLRLAGALHALVLDGADADLASVYPPHPAPNDTDLWRAIDNAMQTHAARLEHWLDSAPQTNEVQRSAVLIAAGQTLAARYTLPIALSELGASGGLNLMWDRFALRIGDTTYGPQNPAFTLTPDWQSDTLPPHASPKVVDRRGVDLNPLNPRDPKDALRLNAYLWPDQTDRLMRSRAAIAVETGVVDKGDVADWLEPRLATPMPGRLHMIYHTIAWQYFPPEVSTRARQLIETAGAKATDAAPIAWVSMEDDGTTPGAGLTLRLWPGDITINLGRADFHGRWLDWRGA